MKKYLLILAAGIFGILTANAYSVTKNDDGSVTIDGGAVDSTLVTDQYGVQHKAFFAGETGAGLPNSFSSDEVALIANATKIKITGYINNMKAFQEMQTQLGGITSVDMSGAWFEQNLNEGNTKTVTFNQYNPTTKETTPVTRIYMKNVMSFEKFPNASEVKLSEHVESLWDGTFKSNGKLDETTGKYTGLTTTFTIPASVKYLDVHTVVDTPISTITIPSNVEYIQSEAFMNASIATLIDVTVDGYTAAGTNAFDFMVTVGQTQADYQNYANLHFPEGAEAFFQNLSHPLTQAVSLNKKAFQEYLKDHKDYQGANGWQQFISSGPGKEIKVEGKVVLRTYSDKVARMVPLNFRAYIVTGVTDANVNGKKQYTLKLQQIFAIPAYTGVILYGAVNDNSTGYTLSPIPSWDDVAPYNRGTGVIDETEGDLHVTVDCKNYMVPMVEPTVLYPYYKDAPANWAYDTKNLPNMKPYYKTSGGTVTDRNFVLAQYSNTTVKEAGNADYWGFFRVKAGAKSSANKAYLSLPKDVFKSAKGAEALVVKPTSPDDMKFRTEEWNQAVSTGNWGQRGDLGVLEAKFVGEIEEDEVTGISYVNIEVEEDGDYYNLHGVKVAQPQKGVYIKNGKKVVVK